jgi:biotin synthase-like enzyme
MNYEDLVRWIRLNKGINMNSPFCLNNDCLFYKNNKDKDINETLKRSELVEVNWMVDINGYLVNWKCPYCSYRSTTGNMHTNFKDLLDIHLTGAKRLKEIRHLILNPQGVAP